MKVRTASSLNWLKRRFKKNLNLMISAGYIMLGGTALGLRRVQSGQRNNIKFNGKTAVRCNISSSTNYLKNLTHTLYEVHQNLGLILPSFF